MYNLYSFLEPLGIVPNIPTVSQENADPWNNTFPVEKASYRLFDDEDDTARCPQCLHEVFESACDNCGAEFSDEEGDNDSVMFDDMTDEDGYAGMNATPGGRRRAQVDIATIEEVLGDSVDEGDEPPRPRPAGPLGANRAAERLRSRRRIGAINDSETGSESEDDDDLSPTAREQARALLNRFRLGRRPPYRATRFGSPEDPDATGSDSDATQGFSDGDAPIYGRNSEADSEDEYDGAVPRVLPAVGPVIHSADDEDDMDEDGESAYGGSFIDDDEEEEGYDLESTGSLHDEGDEDVDNADASDGLDVEEDEEEEAQGSQPNLGQLRRLRLQRLADGRRYAFLSHKISDFGSKLMLADPGLVPGPLPSLRPRMICRVSHFILRKSPNPVVRTSACFQGVSSKKASGYPRFQAYVTSVDPHISIINACSYHPHHIQSLLARPSSLIRTTLDVSARLNSFAGTQRGIGLTLFHNSCLRTPLPALSRNSPVRP